MEPRVGQDGSSTSSASNGLDDDSEGSMMVRVLDVQGQTYTLRVRPGTRVSELKTRLVEIAGMEIARQRTIWSGKVRKRLLQVLFPSKGLYCIKYVLRRSSVYCCTDNI